MKPKLSRAVRKWITALIFVSVVPWLTADACGAAVPLSALPGDTIVPVTEAPPGPPPAPAELKSVKDTPDDHGHSLELSWQVSPEDDGTGQRVVTYEVWRGEKGPDGNVAFKLRKSVPFSVSSYTDGGDRPGGPDPLPNNHNYWYKLRTIAKDGQASESAEIGPVHATGQWFHRGKSPVAVATIVFLILTVYFVYVARKGKELYIRPLAGIQAVDEAIGRATEMGKPILYVLGIGTASEIATIASFTILGRVAKKVADHQTPIKVPCYDPIVMTVAQEIVKNAYSEAGRPDAYDSDSVFFVTNSQFAYVAAVNGMMLRELPASNFYLGYFAAESLLLAETGAIAGSIQISGTDQVAQLPFFVVACDYTLIGEELYAASAYLGREPLLMGALKAEDWGKGLFIALLLLGTLAFTFGWKAFADLFVVRI